jgi:hypothetical protein
MLLLAMMLAVTLTVTSPALANHQDGPRLRDRLIEGYPDYEITDESFLVYQGDAVVGKCGSSPQRFAFQSASLREEAASACEKASYSAKGSRTQDGEELQTQLTKTGGLPIILIPIALLAVGGLLIRKSTAQ